MKRLIIFYLFLIASYTIVTRVVLKMPEVNDFLSKEMPLPSRQVIRREFPKEKPFEFPVEYLPIHEKLKSMFNDLSASMVLSGVPVVIISDFSINSETVYPSLPRYLAMSAYDYLLPNKNIRPCIRDHSRGKTRIKSTYVLIGKMNPLEDMFHITVRLEKSETGEIIEAFDDVIEKDFIASFMQGQI